jgi:sugar phosphate isomerase/epimerase
MSLPIEQACRRIAELGFEAIDVWSAHAGCPHLDDVLSRLGPEGLKELLAKNNLNLYAFSVYAGGYRRYAELLGKAGGGVAVRGSSGPCDPKELTARMKAFLEGLKPDVELAEKYDSFLAIENHGHALLNSLDSMKAFVDANTSPHLGIALAPYHVQGQEESVEEAIAICGKQLFFFYAWQRAGGTDQLPGFGPTDCAPWIAALAKAGYTWYGLHVVRQSFHAPRTGTGRDVRRAAPILLVSEGVLRKGSPRINRAKYCARLGSEIWCSESIHGK